MGTRPGKALCGLLMGAALGAALYILVSDEQKRKKIINFGKAAYSSFVKDINISVERISAAIEAGRKAARNTELRLEQEASLDSLR